MFNMLYVSGMSGKKYAVTDTDDNITELVSRTAIGKLICKKDNYVYGAYICDRKVYCNVLSLGKVIDENVLKKLVKLAEGHTRKIDFIHNIELINYLAECNVGSSLIAKSSNIYNEAVKLGIDSWYVTFDFDNGIYTDKKCNITTLALKKNIFDGINYRGGVNVSCKTLSTKELNAVKRKIILS